MGRISKWAIIIKVEVGVLVKRAGETTNSIKRGKHNNFNNNEEVVKAATRMYDKEEEPNRNYRYGQNRPIKIGICRFQTRIFRNVE